MFKFTHGTACLAHGSACIGGRTYVLWIQSLLGVRIRSIQEEVVSVIQVGDVTRCRKLFSGSKRCVLGLWWKSELKSPKTKYCVRCV